MAVAIDQTYVQSRPVEETRLSGLPFSFTGRAGEYFGIWIVNILLSIVTLGIYSAWAKVRNKRYFYGNTRLEGSSFDYLASPLQILKGRLIAFAFLGTYALCSTFYPTLAWILLVAMFFITPWVVIRAFAFNARNSSYRNVRFDFLGTLGESVKLYILLPIASLLTLGGLIPYAAFRTNRFFVDNSRFGQTAMTFGGEVRSYYLYYGITFLISLPAVLIIAASTILSLYVGIESIRIGEDAAAAAVAELLNDYILLILPYLSLLPYIIGGSAILWIVGSAYLTTKLQNYLFNNTKIGDHELALDLKFSRVLWIRFTNLLAIALTVGLMIPWAKIRMTRYQVERMSIIPRGDLDALVSQQQGSVGAYGDELGEGMDLDIGLGI